MSETVRSEILDIAGTSKLPSAATLFEVLAVSPRGRALLDYRIVRCGDTSVVPVVDRGDLLDTMSGHLPPMFDRDMERCLDAILAKLDFSEVEKVIDVDGVCAALHQHMRKKAWKTHTIKGVHMATRWFVNAGLKGTVALLKPSAQASKEKP